MHACEVPPVYYPRPCAGNWAKQQLFEASLRVPLIIAPPSAPATSSSSGTTGGDAWLRNVTIGPSDAFVEALDLFPTLAELLGAAPAVPPGQLQGRSLVPLLRAQPLVRSRGR